MLSERDNETLTRVGKGTPMGELLRRYWYPVAALSELDQPGVTGRPGTKEVRLLGEDLVLFKDLMGRIGLVQRGCAHRRVNLAFGMPEEKGLRCPYHGWMYDVDGRCVEQPFEETSHPDGRFKDTIHLTAYPVQELGGLLFAYLGPDPAPLLPRWDLFAWENVVREIEYAVIPCNWLQIMENSVDTVHGEWLHSYYTAWITQTENRRPRTHLKIAFDLFEHGIIKRRLRDGDSEDAPGWNSGHPLVIPNMLRLHNQMQIRVPMDDENTLHILYNCYLPPEGGTAPHQDSIPMREVPMFGDDGRRLLDFNQGQDTMAWVTQGSIAPREQEKLGESDRGLSVLRRLYQEQLEIVRDGGDPMNVLRDPSKNTIIELPTDLSANDDTRRSIDNFNAGGVQVGGLVGRRGLESVRSMVQQMYETPSETR